MCMDLGVNLYNRPTCCSRCGGIMVFVGVGEYHCEDCKNVEYDDYGKVRLYIEQHKGATAAQIENEIGVSQKAIRQMLRDAKIEIAAESKIFMKCEICGINIRSGRYCEVCEANYHNQIEEEQRKIKLHNANRGYGLDTEHDFNGEKRFQREH